MSLNSKQQEALIKELVKLLQEQPEGRKKLPKGRPPEKLRQAIKQINGLRFQDDPEMPEEEPNAILANPPKSDVRNMTFKKGPGAQSYEREKAKQISGPQTVFDDPDKMNFDKPVPHDYKAGAFDIKQYLELQTPKARLNYARLVARNNPSGFLSLGEGSSRVAFNMPGTGKVLKIALNNKGVAQNKSELDITRKIHLTNSDYPIVTKIFGHDDENQPTWLISEAVQEASVEDFSNLVGVPWDLVVQLVDNKLDLNIEETLKNSLKGLIEDKKYFDNYYKNNSNDPWYKDRIRGINSQIEKFKKLLENPSELQNNKFIKALEQLKTYELLNGDTTRLEHWGKTEDGRLVLLDYGFTPDVAVAHYGMKPNIKTNRFAEAHLNEDDNLEQHQDGPFIKGLAKGLAHVAYPFVKMKHTVESIDHFEVLDVIDFAQNDFFNKMGGEGVELIPTKVKLGAITPSGRIKKIFNVDVKVLPYGGKYIGGTLAIDIDSLPFDIALEFQSDATRISQELSDEYLSPGIKAGKKNKKV